MEKKGIVMNDRSCVFWGNFRKIIILLVSFILFSISASFANHKSNSEENPLFLITDNLVNMDLSIIQARQ